MADKPTGPLASPPPAEPIADFDVERLLAMEARPHEFRNIGMDEQVDLRALTEKNGGKPPRFTVMKKSTIEAFKAKLHAAPRERMPRLDETVDRLVETLKAGGAEVVRTNTAADSWLRQPWPDGKISIPVDRDVKRRLKKAARPGETDEDVINRIMDKGWRPTHPKGTPEYDLAMELGPLLIGGALDEGKAANINKRLQAMTVEKRFQFLQHELIDVLGPNDGTDAWSEKLGCLMAFVHGTLPEEMAHRMADEVLEKLKPASADDHLLMDKVAREAAEKIEKMLERLPPDMAAKVVTALFAGNMMVEDGATSDKVMPGYTDHVTRHLAASGKGRATIQRLLNSENVYERWTPEQRAKLQRYLDTGDTGPALSVIKDKRRALDAVRERLDRETARLAAAARHNQAMIDIAAVSADPRLSRLGETGFHKAVTAWQDGSIIMPQDKDELRWVANLSASIFVVQHDWAAAFQNATDFSEGEFQLPYSDVVFEFRIGGRRVCCCIRSEESVASMCSLLIETSVGWALGAMYSIANATWTHLVDGDDLCAPILNVCRDQVRAVCIALEAKVVETEIVRAPHRLNRKRERAGKIPVFDHHVVNLANRKRYLPREPLPGDLEDEKHGKRLHFVRGHTRHYTNHKVWINWHLRGNPDLGFVEKHYKL